MVNFLNLLNNVPASLMTAEDKMSGL